MGSASDDGIDFAVKLVGIIVVEGGFRRRRARVFVMEGERSREGEVVADGRREKRGRMDFWREKFEAGEVGWERD